MKDNPGRRTNLERLEKIAGKIRNELYNLSKDPKEEINVFEEEKEVAEQLHAKLIDFLREVGTEERYLKYWTRI